jgi:hypothetical protein
MFDMHVICWTPRARCATLTEEGGRVKGTSQSKPQGRIQGASRRSLLMKRVSPYKVRAVSMFIHQMALWTKDGPPVPPPSIVGRSPSCCTASARKHTHIVDVFWKAKALTRETSICPSPYIRALRTLLHGLIGCSLTLSSDATGINNPPKSSALN